METTVDVRLWKMKIYKGVKVTTYYVRWVVDGEEFKEPFRNKAQAETFQADLVRAMSRGEAFDVSSGLPLSKKRATVRMSWYEFACKFTDYRWPDIAGTTRRTQAEALTAVAVAMLDGERGRPDAALIRKALNRWGFNTLRRPEAPPEIQNTLRWIAENSKQVSALTDPEVLRPVLKAIGRKLDGARYKPSVSNRRQKIFNTSVGYAVEIGLLTENPVPAAKAREKVIKTVQAVDRRAVANPIQARTLIESVRNQPAAHARLAAFFGCLYYGALRPEEAVGLTEAHLDIPREGWGVLYVETAEPHAGWEWTDSGKNRDSRQLKQRAVGEVRPVPCCPDLTSLLHWHIETFGTAAGGRLFVGARNKQELPKLTIIREWQRARAEVFTAEVAASPLAGTPYDLRHAAVSTQLNAGIPPTRVAEWAGHSVEILLKTYAKCVDGDMAVLRQRMEVALGHKVA